MTRGSVRRAVRIRRDADAVWEQVGDPARLAEWFPGIADAQVEGDHRTITTDSGVALPELILTDDALLRRFQYRLTLPILTEHTSTLDVHDLGDGTSLVVYAVDADPNTMALIIGGAGGHALEALRHQLEAGLDDPDDLGAP